MPARCARSRPMMPRRSMAVHLRSSQILKEMAKVENSLVTARYSSTLPYALGDAIVKYRLIAARACGSQRARRVAELSRGGLEAPAAGWRDQLPDRSPAVRRRQRHADRPGDRALGGERIAVRDRSLVLIFLRRISTSPAKRPMAKPLRSRPGGRCTRTGHWVRLPMRGGLPIPLRPQCDAASTDSRCRSRTSLAERASI